MAWELKTNADLIRILAAGGGLTIDCKLKTVEDAVRLAAAAKGAGARLTLTGLKLRTTADLVRIAAAGSGVVVLDE